ncbi:hypothetical protein CTheo_3256 [Ceratobasidium theobromae]|uniref:cAMP-independent regulatory protein pac2 n=1 Tax=Ceratobasidium theobromae TaxID=1582974 RepID=A0A5N5QP09_9AGAM|nr:hypothetical protein CTheo_3256 [Ceratobasidium theobromae]
MSLPTLQGVTVNSVASALTIFYAVCLRILPKVERRLDVDERESLKTGDIYVWEERDLHLDTGEGIERWTDGIKWGSSRVRNEFLFYYERDHDPKEAQAVQDARLIKQTFSVFFHPPGEPSGRPRKWHMVAYYSQATVANLNKVEDIPHIATLQVPEGMFQPARAKRGRVRSAGSGSPSPRLTLDPSDPRPASPIIPHPQRIGSSPLGPRSATRPYSPYGYVSSSPESDASYMDRPWHGAYRSRTPESSARPITTTRAHSWSSEPTRSDWQSMQTSAFIPHLEVGQEQANLLKLPHFSSSCPPSGMPDSRRILPPPVFSSGANNHRISTDHIALNALQSQFMK